MYQYVRHPDLDPDISWRPRWQYDAADTALTLHNAVLVQMLDRILRQCTDFNNGRHGAERWVAELRAIVAKKVTWVRKEKPQGGRSRA